MRRKVQAYIEEYRLLTADMPVLVGVSGGADSVALLAVLAELGFACIAAHANFHLRGEESDRDAAFTRSLAEKIGVPFYSVDFDTVAYASSKQISIEMAARELRYAWFEELRQILGAQAIAVAHHEQDNVETVLLNLIRGTGIKGLTGMQPKNGWVVRPLLRVRKEEILRWLAQKGLGYVTDSTNLSDEFTRNFLRLRVIPLLETINPAVSDAITRTAANLTEVERLYADRLAEVLQRVVEENRIVHIPLLLETTAPRTVLYEFLKRFHFNGSVVNDVFHSLNGESGRVFYSPTHQLVKDRDRLLLRPLSACNETTDSYPIGIDQTEIVQPIKLALHQTDWSENSTISKEKHIATLDFEKLQFPLSLRRWKEGDWFIPFGMKGRKKLSDYFTDAKFSLIDKEQVWLLCSDDRIVWIVGERIDNRFRIEKNSPKALIIHFFE